MQNIYNANLEKVQLSTLTKVKNMLNNVSNISTKQIILGGNLNFYFDLLLEAAKGGNPVFKKNQLKQQLRSKKPLTFATGEPELKILEIHISTKAC